MGTRGITQDNVHEEIKNIKFWECLLPFSSGPLPVVLCGCKTWSVTLTEEHRSRVLENRVLRRIFPVKREEVSITGCRKLYNEETHNL